MLHKVSLRPARLVPGRVNVLRRVNHLVQNQASYPSVGRRNNYQRKLGE